MENLTMEKALRVVIILFNIIVCYKFYTLLMLYINIGGKIAIIGCIIVILLNIAIVLMLAINFNSKKH